MKKRRGINTLGVFFIIFLFVTALLWASFAESQIDLAADQVQNLQKQAQAVLQANLQAANDEDLEAYLATIVNESRIETQAVMQAFFQDFDVHHDLMEFEITEISDGKLKAKSQQQTTNHSELPNYRNHIATVLLVFIQEEDEWKIAESNISDVEFIP